MRSIRKNRAMDFDISFVNKEITPWGGMVLLKQMLQKIGFSKLIEENPDLPVSGSNRGYKTEVVTAIERNGEKYMRAVESKRLTEEEIRLALGN